jgi:hypothetical protein
MGTTLVDGIIIAADDTNGLTMDRNETAPFNRQARATGTTASSDG